MPTPTFFEQIAPFPPDVPIADIPTVSLQRLEASEPFEEGKVWDACRRYGFFLLDLRDSDGALVADDAATMYKLATDTLNLDRQVLEEFKHNPPMDLRGYKPIGTTKTDDGVDVTSTYTIGQDDLLGTSRPRKHPQPIEDRKADCCQFIRRANTIANVIFGALDAQLGIPRGTLADRSSITKESATSMRLILSRPQASTAKKITTGAHTDAGLLTLLFNVVGGLQILPADKENVDENWRYIRPQSGCVLVNVGDALVEWTGWLLQSSLHRVVTPPGGQGQTTRLSLAYLIRPSNGESMRRIRGSDKIPLTDGEEETRTFDTWVEERVDQSNKGILRPRSHGGMAIASH